MTYMNEEKKWFAIYTNPRSEKKVADLLTKKSIENYCPLTKVQKQWSDRKKITEEPLFKSYVFVRITPSEHLSVITTFGVLNFVYWLNRPAVIRNDEIKLIQDFLKDHSFVKLEKNNVTKHDTIQIINGPLMSQKGHVLSVENKYIKVILPSLGYAMLAVIETVNVKVLTEKNIQSKTVYRTG